MQVQRLARMVPSAPLRRMRWLFLVFVIVLLAVSLGQLVLASAMSPLLRGAAALAAFWLMLRRVREYRQDALWRPVWDVPEGLGLALIMIGTGADNSLGLIFIGVNFRSLYVGRARAAGGAALYLVAHVAASLVEDGNQGHADEMLFMESIGITLSTIVMQVIADTLRLHERAMGREQILARTGAAVAAGVDRQQIGAAVMDGSAALLAEDGQDALISLWSGTLERVAAVAAAGPEAQHVLGASFTPADLPDPYRGPYITLQSAQFGPGDGLRAELARTLAHRPRAYACVLPLVIQGELRGALVVSSERALPGDCRESLESLSTQAALALERVALSEDLHRREGEARFRAVIQHASDVIAFVDLDTTIRFQSPSAERVLGYGHDSLLGTPIRDLLSPEHAASAAHLLSVTANDPDGSRSAEWRVRHQDGSWRDVEVTTTNLLHEPTVSGIVLNLRDITERKALEAELAFRAFHDALTGLPNRSLLVDRLDQALARGSRNGRGLAVLFVDLDEFKLVNDSLGHEQGDLLLQAAALRLRRSVRPGDTVARFGGDEFIVLLEDAENVAEAISVAQRSLDQLQVPIELGGRELFVGASIGIAWTGAQTASADDLLRQADVAMYAAKAAGKGQYAVFSERLDTRPLDRLELEADLRRAIERQELELHYQPIVDLRSGRIGGLEALLRWRHPARGLVQPDQFIPLAEETGLIVPIGRWVLEHACRQAVIWNQERAPGSALVMSVNISARQFQDAALVDDVRSSLALSGLPAGWLKLEITETVAMKAGESTVDILQALKSLGVQLAIDDFGTGYSSLGYLKRFPVDTLKIDRVFVKSLGRDAQDTAIVRSVISIATSLDLSITAEGVETLEHLNALRALACDEGQGYFFSRPVPEVAVGALLARDTLGGERLVAA
jgi:diguanylate cyclase (GGDEF)-like protein/PAS domain S-box-containing protein